MIDDAVHLVARSSRGPRKLHHPLDTSPLYGRLLGGLRCLLCGLGFRCGRLSRCRGHAGSGQWTGRSRGRTGLLAGRPGRHSLGGCGCRIRLRPRSIGGDAGLVVGRLDAGLARRQLRTGERRRCFWHDAADRRHDGVRDCSGCDFGRAPRLGQRRRRLLIRTDGRQRLVAGENGRRRNGQVPGDKERRQGNSRPNRRWPVRGHESESPVSQVQTMVHQFRCAASRQVRSNHHINGAAPADVPLQACAWPDRLHRTADHLDGPPSRNKKGTGAAAAPAPSTHGQAARDSCSRLSGDARSYAGPTPTPTHDQAGLRCRGFGQRTLRSQPFSRRRAGYRDLIICAAGICQTRFRPSGACEGGACPVRERVRARRA